MYGDREEKTTNDFSFLERLWLGWMTPLVFRSNWNHFFGEDSPSELNIPEVPKSLNSRTISTRMSDVFESFETKSRYTMYLTLFIVFKFQIFAVSFFELLNVVIMSAQPLVLQGILQTVFPTSEIPSWKSDPKTGVILVFLYWALDVLSTVVTRFSQQLYNDTIIGIKNGLVMMVYRKTLKLSVDEISKLEKKDHSFSSFIMLETYSFSTFFASVFGVVMTILRTCVSVMYLYINLSWPGFLIFVIVTVFLPFGIILVIGLSMSFNCLTKGNNAFSGYLSRIYENIKFIKYNSLEDEYMEKIIPKQKKYMFLPLFLYIIFDMSTSSLFLVFNSISKIVLFSLSSVSYLDIHIVFSSLFIIDRISQNIKFIFQHLMYLSRAMVGASRISDFLSIPENGKRESLRTTSHASKKKSRRKSDNIGIIRIRKMKFSIYSEKTLHVENIHIKKGESVCICSPTDSGKTSFLLSLLGELKSSPISSDSEFEVNGTVSYSQQSPFIFHGTIEENILVGKKLHKDRLKRVLQVCCLEEEFGTDSESLSSVLVTQHGTTISGGQKVRLGIARCLYSDCSIYLIDDIAPHLDIGVRLNVYRNLLEFLSEKTLIFVTNDPMVRSLEHYSTVRCMSIRDLKVGCFEEPDDQGISFSSDSSLDFSDDDSSKWSDSSSNISSSYYLSSSELTEEDDSDEKRRRSYNSQKEIEKNKAYLTKKVSSWDLLKFCFSHFVSSESISKKLSFLLFVILIFVVMKTLEYLLNLWMVFWTDDKLGLSENTYFWVYVSTGLLFPVSHFIYLFLIAFATTQTGMNIQSFVIKRTLRSKLSMFYRTKLGEIINSVAGDYIHGNSWMVLVISQLFVLGLDVVFIVGSLIVSNPIAAFPCISFIVMFLIINILYLRFFRKAIHIFRRNEGLLISAFEGTRDGIVSIRNMEDSSRNFFIERAFVDTNRSAKSIYFFRNLELWKDVRLGVTNSCFMFVSAMLVLMFSRDSSFGVKILSGLSLPGIYHLHFPLHQLCIELQWITYNSVSLERSRNFTQNMDCENVDFVSSSSQTKLKKSQRMNSIEFRNVSLQYHDDTRPVLRNISFGVLRGERILVKGRTGSGKSSLLECLLGGVEYSGEILIDGNSNLPLAQLRSRISIVAQGEYDHLVGNTYRFILSHSKKRVSDRRIFEVLRKVGFENEGNGRGFDLDRIIDSSISRSDQVLLCLARVVIQLDADCDEDEKRIVCFDEVTSGLDEDIMLEKVANVINGKEFGGKTLIMISHKEDLERLIHFDKIFLVQKGKVKII